MIVGVLALQGDFDAHARMLGDLGADVRRVRTPADLDGLAALVLPGGESTTMTLGIAREGLGDPLRAAAGAGMPMLGTCAGMIMLDREHLGIGNWSCRRNAFGRQRHSFEEDLVLPGIAEPPDPPVRGVFIRAPWVADAGPEVEVLASVDGHPVAVRQGDVFAVSFHPELADEPRVHAAFVKRVRERA